MKVGADIQVCHNCLDIKVTLSILLNEVRALRRERLPASPEKIEGLLAAIYTIFQDDGTTAFFIFDECSENNKNATQLRSSISACLKGNLSIRRLSFFLSRICGTYGLYTLEHCGKQREGYYFRVTR